MALLQRYARLRVERHDARRVVFRRAGRRNPRRIEIAQYRSGALFSAIHNDWGRRKVVQGIGVQLYMNEIRIQTAEGYCYRKTPGVAFLADLKCAKA